MRPEITPDDLLAARHFRRARLHAATGDFDGDEWAALIYWFGSRCLACGAAETTVDHVAPLARGGSGDISNLQCLCRACNSHKGTHVRDYRDVRALVQLLEMLG